MKRIFIIFILLFCNNLYAFDMVEVGIYPKLNNGEKWKVGYYESGPYSDYIMFLDVILLGLNKLKWIEYEKMPDFKNHKDSWEWVCNNIKSEYIEFVKEAYWSDNFDNILRIKNKEKFLRSYKNLKLDLVLTLGTMAGQDLSSVNHSVNIIVASCSDPFKSGIVFGKEYSGYKNIHAKVDLDRYERQLRLFYDIVKFRKLGVVYENSLEGRTFAAIDEVEKIAKEKNFEIIREYASFNNIDTNLVKKEIVEAYKKLSNKNVDAVYITVHRGIRLTTLKDILEPLFNKKIITFSMLGSHEVKYGVLMSISQKGFKYAGEFHAEVIAKIFNGANPGDLNQLWNDPPKIAINLETAKIIGFNFPLSFFMTVDEIFDKIEIPKKEYEE